jgi:hypothetical protein
MALHRVSGDPTPGIAMTRAGGPRTTPLRRIDDHVHDEYWQERDQHRFEDRLSEELKGIRGEVKSMNNRLTLLTGALALIAFMLPLIAPFVRSIVGIGN